MRRGEENALVSQGNRDYPGKESWAAANRGEKGYFMLDSLAAMVLLVAMTAVLSYIQFQLIGMQELEAQVTAECMAKDHLEKLCMEEEPGDLGVREEVRNDCNFRRESQKTMINADGMFNYSVDVSWETKRGRQHFAIEKDVYKGSR